MRERLEKRLPILALGMAAVWSLLLYAPWNQRYLDRADFNEFLPLLKRGGSYLESFRLVSEYYWTEGRFMPLTIAYTAAKWWAFGTEARGWQFTTHALMLANVVLTYKVARRLGASRAGGCIGSALMIVGASAVEAWCRVHLSEPEGTLFFLAAVYCAAGFRSDRSGVRAWAALPLLVCAILTKETFVAVAPFVAGVGLAYEGNGSWSIPKMGSREWKWALLVIASTTAAIMPALIARLTSLPSSYSAQYGSLHSGTSPLGSAVQTRFFSFPNPFQQPVTDLAMLAVIAAGWIVGARKRKAGSGWMIGLALLLSLPLAGAIVYMPWPTWAAFYGLPFALAMAVLLALAFTNLMASDNTFLRGATVAALLPGGLTMTARAQHQSGDIYARRNVVGATIDALSIYLLTNRPTQIVVAERYRGEAQTLERYAEATHDTRIPPFHGVGCDSLPSLGKPPAQIVVMNFSYLCSDSPQMSATKIYATSITYRWLDFQKRAIDSAEYSGALFVTAAPRVR